MAIAEYVVNGDFDRITEQVVEGVLNGSVSASMTDQSDFRDGDARCSVRVIERYSYAGGNRVSLSLTFFQAGDGPIRISAITSGGSQAVFFKFNTLGEETFLESVKEVLDRL